MGIRARIASLFWPLRCWLAVMLIGRDAALINVTIQGSVFGPEQGRCLLAHRLTVFGDRERPAISLTTFGDDPKVWP